MTEQRYRAVLQVQAGMSVVEVAEQVGVSRQAVHRWLAWYRDQGLDGLIDRSHRPDAHPEQTPPEVEAAVCELRRNHPKWGQRRLYYELGRNGCPGPIPSLTTIYRILVRNQLIQPVKRRRGRADYKRWQRDRPMELWQMDIVDGIKTINGIEGKVVTGVDDHSRYCVIAAVVPRATGRAVCLALVAAMRRYGIPEQLLTDNGKQFTARFGRGGETMFDRICRENGITHLLTKPRSPTTTGKVERFHHTLQREMLTDHPPFESLEHAQAVIDAFAVEYNTDRPHQSLDMDFPADRFRPTPEDPDLPLRLPNGMREEGEDTENEAGPALAAAPPPGSTATAPPEREAARSSRAGVGSPTDQQLTVEVDRIVPPSGNLTVCQQQFWFGPAHGGETITLWADTTVIHVLRGEHRIKTLPSRLTPHQLRQLLADGGRPARPAPLDVDPDSGPVEVDRLVNPQGSVGLAGGQYVVGYHLAGQRVTLRFDGTVMHVLDLDRVLLRSLPNPVTEPHRLRDRRPGGPAPHVPQEPPAVQRRVSARGAIVVAGQKIQVGITHAGLMVTVTSTDHTFRVHAGGELLTETARTASKPIARFKARKPQRSRSAAP